MILVLTCKKKILVAPLNWGFGHATRCIPIINALIKADFEPILASDGNALLLLKKEFPYLKSYELPSYNIQYSQKGKNLKFKLLLQAPSLISVIKKERQVVSKIIEIEHISGIISDNRFGVVSKKIPSVYITHQLNVLSGLTTFITSKIHQKVIKKFDECWIPDVKEELNFSEKLGHLKKHKFNLKYIGILSRFQQQKTKIKNNVLVLLSGPEPQRTFLETKLLNELKDYKGNVLFVRGIFSEEDILKTYPNFKVVNYLLSNELEKAINQSEIIVARSGYSTIMDLATLGKKAFFIPTPGQFEQEYLAKVLYKKSIAPFSKQEQFTANKLSELEFFSGFKKHQNTFDLNLFELFEGKRKF